MRCIMCAGLWSFLSRIILGFDSLLLCCISSSWITPSASFFWQPPLTHLGVLNYHSHYPQPIIDHVGLGLVRVALQCPWRIFSLVKLLFFFKEKRTIVYLQSLTSFSLNSDIVACLKNDTTVVIQKVHQVLPGNLCSRLCFPVEGMFASCLPPPGLVFFNNCCLASLVYHSLNWILIPHHHHHHPTNFLHYAWERKISNTWIQLVESWSGVLDFLSKMGVLHVLMGWKWTRLLKK